MSPQDQKYQGLLRQDVATGNITAIIFDLGGVLFNIDYSVLVGKFQEMGVGDFDQQFAKARQQMLFDKYERGEIDSGEFRSCLLGFCRQDTLPGSIDTAWNSMLFDLPAERLELLHAVRKHYRTFLLSNTNELHMDWIHRYLQSNYGLEDFTTCFEKVYLSYKMNKRKPEPEIFSQVLEANNLRPEETLFIDDSPQHIAAAQKLGIQCYLLDVERESVTGLFR